MLTDFKKKRKSYSSNNLLKIAGGVVLLIIIILLVIANLKVYQKRKKLISNIDILKNKIENIKKENNSLAESISNENNYEYTEKIAREELDLQKPGEKVFYFIKESENNKENSENTKNIFTLWFNQIINWFKK